MNTSLLNTEECRRGDVPLPDDSEAQDLQLQVMAAAAEPAHRLRLLLHHCVRPPVPPLLQCSMLGLQGSMLGLQDEICARYGRCRHERRVETSRCDDCNV